MIQPEELDAMARELDTMPVEELKQAVVALSKSVRVLAKDVLMIHGICTCEGCKRRMRRAEGFVDDPPRPITGCIDCPLLNYAKGRKQRQGAFQTMAQVFEYCENAADTRTWNVLKKHYANATLFEIASLSKAEFMKIPNLGRLSLNRMEDRLKEVGLSWSNEHHRWSYGDALPRTLEETA